MKFFPRWRVAGSLVFLALAIWGGVEISRKAKVSPEPVQPAEGRRTGPPKSPLAASIHEDKVGDSALAAGMSSAATEATLQNIETAESPAALAPYLSASDPAVRAATVDVMLRLGDSAAVPLLESAAHQLSAEDAAPLLEAARFLALPDATAFLGAKKPEMPAPKEMGGRKPRGMMGRKSTEQAAPAEDGSPPSR